MKNDITKGLEQDAQIVKERMPDMRSTEKNAQLTAKRLLDFIEQRELTRRYIADKIGVSPSVISQFLRGKYEGELKGLINKIHNYIEVELRREKSHSARKFVNTTVAIKIKALITHVQAFSESGGEGKIGLIIGDSGHGKSECLRAFAEANQNSMYIELDDVMTPTQMFAEIAMRLKLPGIRCWVSGITRQIIHKLQNRDMTVILDEASGLSVSMLNRLRQIIAVKSRCPLILAANADLLKTINQPTSRRGYESLDQFTSRLVQVLDLDQLAADKNGGLYPAKDLRALYEYGGIKLSGDAVATLKKIASTPQTGRLRTCSLLIEALHIARRQVKDLITGELIISAARQLGLPQANKISLAVPETKPVEKQAAKAG